MPETSAQAGSRMTHRTILTLTTLLTLAALPSCRLAESARSFVDRGERALSRSREVFDVDRIVSLVSVDADPRRWPRSLGLRKAATRLGRIGERTTGLIAAAPRRIGRGFRPPNVTTSLALPIQRLADPDSWRNLLHGGIGDGTDARRTVELDPQRPTGYARRILDRLRF